MHPLFLAFGLHLAVLEAYSCLCTGRFLREAPFNRRVSFPVHCSASCLLKGTFELMVRLKAQRVAWVPSLPNPLYCSLLLLAKN